MPASRFNLVVAILPPILFVIALASAVHLMLRCRDIEADPEGGALAGAAAADAAMAATLATLATYRDKGRALFWTSVSTLAGFAALTATPVAPIRTLGLWAALGLGFSGLAAFTLLPCLLARTMGRRAELPERALELRLQRLGRRVSETAADRRVWVLTIYSALAVVAACGLPRLSVASNVLHYLAPEHPVRAGIEEVERLGLGLSALELVVTGDRGRPSHRAPARPRSPVSPPALRRIPGVLAVVAATDLLDDVARASPLARAFSAAELRERMVPLVAADAAGDRALARFLAADGSATRLTLFVATQGLGERRSDLAAAGARARASGAAGRHRRADRPVSAAARDAALSRLDPRPVAAPHPAGAGDHLLHPAARRQRHLLRPGAEPLAGAVDPRRHGLVRRAARHRDGDGRFDHPRPGGRRHDPHPGALPELRAELGPRGAVADRMEKTAPAYLLTGVILACGFGVCALSDFAPTARFGLLSAIAIVIAVVADFTLVPALFGRRGK